MFHAVNGRVMLQPFALLAADDDEAVVLQVACVTAAAVEIIASINVSLVQPEVVWVQDHAVGYPSERSNPLALQPPALSIHILIGGSPTSYISSFVCSAASAQPQLGSVVGGEVGIAASDSATLIAFPHLAVAAPLGTAVPIRARCMLPSGIIISTARNGVVHTAKVKLRWDAASLPQKQIPLGSSTAGSAISGVLLMLSITDGSDLSRTVATMPCEVETHIPPSSTTEDYIREASLLGGATFSLPAWSHIVNATFELPSLRIGIPAGNIIAAPMKSRVALRVVCHWIDEAIMSDTAVLHVMPMYLEWAGLEPKTLDAMVNTPLLHKLKLEWPAFSVAAASRVGENTTETETAVSDQIQDTLEALDSLLSNQQVQCEITGTVEVGAGLVSIAVGGNGRSATWDEAEAAIIFSEDLLVIPPSEWPATAAAKGGQVLLQPECIINDVYRAITPPLRINLVLFTLALHLDSILVLPSARGKVLGVQVVASLRWTTVSSAPLVWLPSVGGVCNLKLGPGGPVELLGAITSPLQQPQNAEEVYVEAVFPNVGIAAAPGAAVPLVVECRLRNGEPPIEATAVVSVANWVVHLQASTHVFRLERTAIELYITIPALADIPESRRFQNSSYFPPSFLCTVQTLNGSTALVYPGNVLTSRVEHRGILSGGGESTDLGATTSNLLSSMPPGLQGPYGFAAFSLRLNELPGNAVVLQAACELGGISVTSDSRVVKMYEFTAAWVASSLQDMWIPSSGKYLQPLQPPPTIQFWSTGERILETSSITCEVSARIKDTNSSVEVGLLSPPALGYTGFEDVVRLDRLLITSGAFGVQVALEASCTRGSETANLPQLLVGLPDLRAVFVPPLPPVSVSTQRPFEVRLRLLPQVDVVRTVAAVECVLLCEAAMALAGARAAAINGSIVFDSASLTGVLGQWYQLRVACTLGVMQLPPLPPIDLRIDTCPRGMEPDESRTNCRACSPNYYSVGGHSKCRGCPQAGAVCSSGIITLLPGFFPADTRLLALPLDSALYGVNNNDSFSEPPPGEGPQSALLIDETTVLYACWNAEACASGAGNQTFGCAFGYSGPLCGVCNADVDFVRSGQVCTQCWPYGLNMALLLLVVVIILVALTYIAAFRTVKQATQREILLRILLTYIQMLSSLGLFHAQATETFRDIFGMSEAVGGSFVSAPPLQCVLRLPYYTQFALNLGLPFLMVPLSIVLVATVMLVRSLWYTRSCGGIRRLPFGKRATSNTRMADRIRAASVAPRSVSVGVLRSTHTNCCAIFQQYLRERGYVAPTVFVLFLSYSMLSTTAATLFKCRPEVIDGQRYLATDLSVPCYDVSHFGGMVAAGTMALSFNIGMPLLLAWFLRRNKSRLREPEIFSRFGFLYQGYSVSRGRYAWESVVMLRKFIIVMVASTVEDPWYQAITGITIVVVALVLQAALQPYDNDLYNRLETAVLSVLAATQIISLVYLRSEMVVLATTERQRIDLVVTILLVLLNGAMLLTLATFIVRATRCCICGRTRRQQTIGWGKSVFKRTRGNDKKMAHKSQLHHGHTQKDLNSANAWKTNPACDRCDPEFMWQQNPVAGGVWKRIHKQSASHQESLNQKTKRRTNLKNN